MTQGRGMARVLAWRVARLLAGLLLLTVATSACSDSAGKQLIETPGADAADVDDSGLDQSRDMTARVTVTVSGDRSFTWQGTETVTLTRVGGPGLQVNLLSAGFVTPVPLNGQAKGQRTELFRWGFDVVEDYQDSPGVFTIAPTKTEESGIASNVVMLYAKLRRDIDVADQDDDIEVQQLFDTLPEPCTVEVGPNEATGRLSCPAVEDRQGARISLVAEWEEAA